MVLGHMRPTGAAQDAGYGPDADPELVGKVSLAGSSSGINPADAPDVLWLKDNAGIHSPSLGVHVSDVLGVGAEEQMAGPHAGRIVALVADMQSGWDRAVGQFPREAVRPDLFVANLQSAISVVANVFVVPASSAFDGASPEPLFNGSPSPRIRAGSTTEAPIASWDVGCPGLERCTAVPTVYGDAGYSHAYSSHASDIAEGASHS